MDDLKHLHSPINSEDRDNNRNIDYNNIIDNDKCFVDSIDNNNNTKCFTISEKVKVLSRRALNTTSSVYKISDPDIQQLLYWYISLSLSLIL